MLLKTESFELVCSRTVRGHQKLAVMASTRTTPDGRKLRDGHTVVDCTKALSLWQRSLISGKEARAADAIGISRGVLRRIVGREGNGQWSVIQDIFARPFAENCGGQIMDIEWSENEAEAEAKAKAKTTKPAVSAYLELWRALHSISLGPYVPLTMQCEDKLIDLAGMIGLIRGTPTLQIVGPSGCGKTHLLAHLALICTDYGFIPIIIRARDFSGRINEMLDDAVSSATTLRFAELAGCCATANVTPVVVVDGLNECSPEFRPTLIPALQDLRIHTNARIIISGQTLTEVPSSLQGPTVLLSLPDAEQKLELVEAHLKRPFPADARFALDMISNAHDAMVWAEVYKHSIPGSSRYALYDSFARRHLGSTPDADIAYRALTHLAAEMHNNFVFSLPKAAVATTIARSVNQHAHEGIITGTIIQSGLLQVAAGHAAFRHELVQSFFATGNLLISSNNADALSRTLGRPINAELVEFAIGSLFSSGDIDYALAHCRSTPVLCACLVGRCGPRAARTVADHCVAALGRLSARYCAASFDCGPEEQLWLTIDLSACPPLDDKDQLYLSAAAMIAPEAGLLPPFLATFGSIDAKIERDTIRFRERYPTKTVAWRRDIFTAVYDLSEIHGIFQARGSGANARERYNKIAEQMASHDGFTPGQLYFLMEYLRLLEENAANLIYELATRAWRTGINQLRLATELLVVSNARGFSEDERKRFVKLAKSWLPDDDLLQNDNVTYILKHLGALDDQFTTGDALAEFCAVLAQSPSKDACERAFTLYSQITDHPFEAVYRGAYYQLAPAQRNALLARAVETEATNSLSYSFLLSEIVQNPMPQAASALQRAALAPNRDTDCIQGSVSTFVYAVIALARIGAPLPEHLSEGGAATKAWRCGAEILHTLYRRDITREQYVLLTRDKWQRLVELDGVDVAMRIIHDLWGHLNEPASMFRDWSSHQLLGLSRATLVRNKALVSLFRKELRSDVRLVLSIIDSYGDKSYSKLATLSLEDPVHGASAIKAHAPVSLFSNIHKWSALRSQHLQFGLSMIDSYGDKSDLRLISFLLEDPVHGASAIKAARSIESR
jgi:hypothetical protein